MVTRTPSDTMANSRKEVVPICLPLYSIHAFVFDDYHGPKRQALPRKPDGVSRTSFRYKHTHLQGNEDYLSVATQR